MIKDRWAPRPLAAALVTVVLWASAFVAIRHVGHDVSAGGLALGRMIVGTVVLGAVLFWRRPAAPWPRRRAWPRLLVYGVLWFAVYNVALNAAERRVDAGTAAMLIKIGPILIAILAGSVLGEGFPRRLIAGSVIGFAGVLLIGLATSSGSHPSGYGVVLLIVAAAAYAIAVVSQKPLLEQTSALQVTWLACVIGMVCCLPFAGDLIHALGSAATVGWIGYLGALPTAVGFTTWGYALAHTSAGRLAAMTYLVPPLAIAMGWTFLGETPALLSVVGGAICLTGVYVSSRSTKPARPRARASAGVAEDGSPGGQNASPRESSLPSSSH